MEFASSRTEYSISFTQVSVSVFGFRTLERRISPRSVTKHDRPMI